MDELGLVTLMLECLRPSVVTMLTAKQIMVSLNWWSFSGDDFKWCLMLPPNILLFVTSFYGLIFVWIIYLCRTLNRIPEFWSWLYFCSEITKTCSRATVYREHSVNHIDEHRRICLGCSLFLVIVPCARHVEQSFEHCATMTSVTERVTDNWAVLTLLSHRIQYLYCRVWI